MWEGGKTVNVHGMRPMGQDLPLKQTGSLLKGPSEPLGQEGAITSTVLGFEVPYRSKECMEKAKTAKSW